MKYSWDVFISYRHQDPGQEWVKKKLLPALESKGLRTCIDFRDFQLGAPLVTEMANAIEKSKYTLAVLTPSYLDSNFTLIENILAEHHGLETGKEKLICIMRENCIPRLGLRARLWLDMTKDDQFKDGIKKLTNAILNY